VFDLPFQRHKSWGALIAAARDRVASARALARRGIPHLGERPYSR
jgi:hypothetical protein